MLALCCPALHITSGSSILLTLQQAVELEPAQKAVSQRQRCTAQQINSPCCLSQGGQVGGGNPGGHENCILTVAAYCIEQMVRQILK